MSNFNKFLQCNSCGNSKEWQPGYQEETPDCDCGNDSWTIFQQDNTLPPIPPGQESRFWSNPYKYKLPKRLAE